jgi:hypothetical protein
MTEANQEIHVIRRDAGSSRELAAQHRQKQSRGNGGFPARKPAKAVATRTSWLGGKKYSALDQQHNDNLDKIDYALGETRYTVEAALELETVIVSEGALTVESHVAVFRSMPADTLEAVVTQELTLDSVERIRELGTDAAASFRSRTLGSR